MATIDYKQKIKDYMNSSEVDTLYKSMLNNLFPELAESEDEKIRKAIGYAIGQSTHSDGTLINGVSSEEALTWLEKQGENSPVLSNSSNIGKVEQKPAEDRYMEGYLNGINDTLKSAAWSEEDRIHLGNCIALVQRLSEDEANWLKSLRPRNTWKPSDEQISVLEFVMEDIEKDSIRYAVLNSVLEQLKKLRE